MLCRWNRSNLWTARILAGRGPRERLVRRLCLLELLELARGRALELRRLRLDGLPGVNSPEGKRGPPLIKDSRCRREPQERHERRLSLLELQEQARERELELRRLILYE